MLIGAKKSKDIEQNRSLERIRVTWKRVAEANKFQKKSY